MHADLEFREMNPQHVLVEVKARTVVQVLAIVLAALALIELLSAARDVLILLGISLFLAVALNPAVVLVQRWLPRGLAVASVFTGLLVLIGLFVVALAVPIINQTNHLQEAAPGYVDKLKKDPTLNDLNERYHLVSKASAAAGKLPARVFGAADKLVTGIAETITASSIVLPCLIVNEGAYCLLAAQSWATNNQPCAGRSHRVAPLPGSRPRFARCADWRP